MLMRKRRNTDYAQGRFDELGLFLFTTRNGSIADLSNGKGMFNAEKIMPTRENQLSPMHRHNIKAEDIINGGGGNLIIELHAPDEEGGIDRESVVTVPSDATQMTLEAGGHLRLIPGQSATLMPGVWRAFWAEKATALSAKYQQLTTIGQTLSLRCQSVGSQK